MLRQHSEAPADIRASLCETEKKQQKRLLIKMSERGRVGKTIMPPLLYLGEEMLSERKSVSTWQYTIQ